MTVHQLKFILKICLIALVLSGIIWGIYAFKVYIQPADYQAYLESGSFEDISTFQPLEHIEPLDGMVAAYENDYLRLYVDTKTSAIAVMDKASDNVYYSNPVNMEDDPLANGVNKELLASQLYIEYFDQERLKKEMNNYSDAIKEDQFTIEAIDQGIRITYTIGDLSKGVESLPKYITPDRLESLVLTYLDEKASRDVLKYYVESAKEPGYLEMRQQVADARIVLNKMLDAFEEAGYSEEDLEYDNSQVGYVSDIQKIRFTIPVDYKLVEDEFVAKINTEEIITDGPGNLAVISFLQYFGAGYVEDSGYLLVPSGSGALIEFNNGKENHDFYYERVYGMDPVVASKYATQNQTPVRMPIYGIKNNDQAFITRITDGEAIAAIKADVSGRTNSFNYVGPVFTIRDNELISMFGASGINADLPLVEKRSYSGDLALAYTFLSGDDADYSGMANAYRENLLEEGVLNPVRDDTLSMYIDVVGVVEKKAFVLGMPYRDTSVLTSPEAVMEIANQLNDEAVSNIKIRYQGWFNDGYYHDVARDIDVENDIGGAKGMEALEEQLGEIGASLYPDVAFSEVSSLSDHYSETFESSRYIAGVNVFTAPYHPSLMRMYTFYEEDFMRVVSPKAIIKHVNGFVDDFSELQLSALSLRDMGDIVTSDKNIQRPIDREWSKDILAGMVDILGKETNALMIAGGNAYTWSQATDIIDCPVSANYYYIIDESIPFMQMVLHGSINYGSTPINLSAISDQNELFLKLLETGTAPRYVFTDEASKTLVKTAYQNFYATDYRDWMDEAVGMHHALSEVLDSVHNAYMIGHQAISDQVVCVSYSSGVEIYINYRDSDFIFSDLVIPAKGYILVGGE